MSFLKNVPLLAKLNPGGFHCLFMSEWDLGGDDVDGDVLVEVLLLSGTQTEQLILLSGPVQCLVFWQV